MRRLDDILLQYEHAAPSGRLLLLRQLGTVPLAFDHARVLAFLSVQAGLDDRWLGYLAHVETQRAGPAAVACDFGFRMTVNGLRSLHHLDQPPVDPLIPDEVHRVRLAASLSGPLSALVDALADVAASSSQTASEALLCLGAVHTAHSIERLSALAKDAHVGPRALVALAASSSRRARRAASGVLKGMAQPDGLSVASLRFLPLEDHREILARPLSGDDRDLGTAIAAEGHAGAEAIELVRRVLSSPDPWVRAHGVQSLATLPQGLDVARDTYRQESAPLLRALAVRATAACDSREAREFLIEIFPDATEANQAVILEALAESGEDDHRRVGEALAGRFLASADARLRVASIMLLARDPDLVAEPLLELLSQDQPALQMEGAFCLGYLPCPSSARRLEEILRQDRSGAVSLGAIASLSRFPADLAKPALLAGLGSQDFTVRHTALRALGDAGEGDPVELLALARTALVHAETVPERSALLELAGRLAAHSGQRALLDDAAQRIAHVDQELLPAALDAYLLSGVPPQDDQLAGLAAVRAPEVSSRVVLWRFLSGDTAAPDELASLVRGPETRSAIRTARQLFALLPYIVHSRRFSRLEERLFETRATDPESPPQAVSGAFEFSLPPEQLAKGPASAAIKDALAERGGGGPSRTRQGSSPARARSLRWTGQFAQYQIPPPAFLTRLSSWQRTLLVGLALAGLGIVRLGFRGPRPVAITGVVRAAPIAPARLAGLTVDRAVARSAGGGEVHPAQGKILVSGVPFQTRGLLVLVTPFPVSRLVCHPGGGELETLRRQAAPSFGYHLEMKLDEGEYRLETRLGATQGALHVPWGTITCTMANLDLVVGANRGRIALDCGKVTIESPPGTIRTLQGPAEWEGP